MSYIRKSILYSLLILLKIYNKFLANMNNENLQINILFIIIENYFIISAI